MLHEVIVAVSMPPLLMYFPHAYLAELIFKKKKKYILKYLEIEAAQGEYKRETKLLGHHHDSQYTTKL